MGDLVKAVASHFQHCDLVLPGQATQCDGQAKATTVILRIVKYVVTPLQHRRYRLPGAGFACGAGDAHDRYVHRAQDKARPIRQSCLRIGYDQTGRRMAVEVGMTLAHHTRCATFDGFDDMVVTVSFVGFDGEKQLPRLHSARVKAKVVKVSGVCGAGEVTSRCFQQIAEIYHFLLTCSRKSGIFHRFPPMTLDSVGASTFPARCCEIRVREMAQTVGQHLCPPSRAHSLL